MLSKAIIRILLIIFLGYRTNCLIQCHGKGEITATTCSVSLGESVCLICPINITKNNLIWYKGMHQIYYDGLDLEEGSFSANCCHEKLSSLQVMQVDPSYIDETFTCTLPNSEPLAEFAIRIVGNSTISLQIDEQKSFVKSMFLVCTIDGVFGTLTINWLVNEVEVQREWFVVVQDSFSESSVFNYTYDGSDALITCKASGPNIYNMQSSIRLLGSKKGNSSILIRVKSYTSIGKSLECALSGALGNVTLTWLVNRVKKFEDRFIDAGSNVTSYFNYIDNGQSDLVTCKASGDDITDIQSSIHIGDSEEDNEDVLTPSNGGPVIFGFVVAIVGIGAGCFFLKRYYTKTTMSVTIEPTVPMSARPTNARQTTNNSDCNHYMNVSLNTCIKTGFKYEYWQGTINTPLRGVERCLAKSMSSDSTLEDASQYRRLAGSVHNLRRHQNIVNILHISVENVPTIYYEFMESGTLRDFVMARYQQSRQSQAGIDNIAHVSTKMKTELEELLSFSCDIASAMVFLTSQKHSHPILLLRKVLITNHCKCKIFDIFPTDMAMRKIAVAMKKDHPPIAWLAPETIFMKEYCTASDVWNYAVLLWEIFSLGGMPHARTSKSQVEENVRQSIVLLQPPNCPGAVYNLMLSCWNKSKDKRPHFDTLYEKLKETLGSFSLGVRGENIESHSYVTLNRQDPHYI